MISIIVAVAKNNAIGKDNRLLWHLSEDLKYFKKTTLGHCVVMGYNTFLSVNSRPFPNRRNIIVNNAIEDGVHNGIESYSTLEKALKAATEDDEEAFVIGGGMLYRTSLPFADKLYITEVDKVVEDADTYFPIIDLSIWKETSRSEQMVDEKSGLKFTFVTYVRK
jgi:dihydrofolate reductase